MKSSSLELIQSVPEITEVEDKTTLFLVCMIQFDQKAKLYSRWQKDYMQTILLPLQDLFLYHWLLYSDIQIGFKLSWIESLGSVLGSMQFLVCSLQCAQMTILFSVCQTDHSITITFAKSYYWLLYSNTQISFKSSWTESLGSVLGSMLFVTYRL